MYTGMIRVLAKRASLSRTRLHIDTMLLNRISRTSHGLRCFALTAASSADSAPVSELRLDTASLNAIAATKKAAPKKKKLDSVNTLLAATKTEAGLQENKLDTLLTVTKTKAAPKKKKLDSATESQFPVYSYDHCKPLPTVVYTRHEGEANELIARLKAGYVLSINISQFLVCL
jgi:hypothetical protein